MPLTLLVMTRRLPPLRTINASPSYGELNSICGRAATSDRSPNCRATFMPIFGSIVDEKPTTSALRMAARRRVVIRVDPPAGERH